MIEIAIIGPTACGKSDTALKIAQKHNAYILSLDSLSLYKEVDIASAKPSKEELLSVKHFGVDILYPNEEFNAAMFMDEYEKAKNTALKDGKNLIIVGGSSFYLKSMIEGLSDMPPISKTNREKATQIVKEDAQEAHKLLSRIDPEFAAKIKEEDSYRIGRGLEMFFEFHTPPSKLFDSLPKKKVAEGLKIYEILIDREELREKIRERTSKMFEIGIIDEALYLESRYGGGIKALNSIGLKETLEHTKGVTTAKEAMELISIHTSQLAKRQVTFNKTQLSSSLRGDKNTITKELESLF